MTVANWNVERATPGSWSRRDEILKPIDREAPDIVCLTESDIRLLAGMSTAPGNRTQRTKGARIRTKERPRPTTTDPRAGAGEVVC